VKKKEEINSLFKIVADILNLMFTLSLSKRERDSELKRVEITFDRLDDMWIMKLYGSDLNTKLPVVKNIVIEFKPKKNRK